jgi:plasmid stability protein
MAASRDEQIEAEARAILRETIERSGWYPGVSKAVRAQLIEQDVDRHWYLMREDAVKRLDQREKL